MKTFLQCLFFLLLLKLSDTAAQTIQTNPLPAADLPAGSSLPDEMIVLEHNQLIFTYRPAPPQRTIALLDGATKNVLPLRTFFSSSFKLNPITLSANRAVFIGLENSTGQELWTTDKTTAGTLLLKDLNPGNNSSDITFGAVLNNKVFFLARETGNDGQSKPISLWITDGTSAGTIQLSDSVNEGTINYNNPFIYTVYKNAFYFYGKNPASDLTELWRSDGTVNGTLRIMTFNNFVPQPNYFAVLNDTLYFHGYDAAHGEELWRSKGSFNSTALVKDMNPGPGSSSPKDLTIFNNKVWFIASNGAGYQLWHSNSTAASTTTLYSGLNAEDYILGATSAKLYFTIDFASWLTNGTSAGTAKLSFGSSTYEIEYPRDLHEINGIAYFTLTDYAYSMVRNDGTAKGTSYVDGPFSGLSEGLAQAMVYNGRMVFVGGDDQYLGETDGTTDRDYSNTYSYVDLLAQDEKYVYLSLYDDSTDQSVWRIDMTLPITSDEICNGLDDNTNGNVDDVAQFDHAAAAYSICKKSYVNLYAILKEGITFQWLKKDVPIPGATSYYYTVVEKGEYSFIAHMGSCTDTSPVIKVSTLPLPDATITPLGNLDICQTGSVTLQANGGGPGSSYQWKKGSANVSGATNQTYVASEEKKYSVVVKGANGCSKQSNKVEVYSSCKSVNEWDQVTDEIIVYPNPATDMLCINLKNGGTAAEAVVYDLSGRKKLTQNFFEGSARVDVSALATGMYLLEVKHAGSISTIKFVVERE